MQLHLTTGTITYMEGIKQKHPEVHIGAMGQDAMLYYEDDSKDSIFSSRHSYTVDHSDGDLGENNATSVHFIPIAENKTGVMLGHLSDLNEKLQKVNGVMSYRIGKSVNDESYAVLIQWAAASTYNDFKETDDYRNYLSTEALKKFRTAESLFHQSISTKFFLPMKDNEENTEDPEQEF
ncbi:hypothetical protein [Salinicoccus sp. HZC-1]|uniref:hypothetical protein n=1 Tax=Salinicoccus sp. HZC-1 TaxID=3385497 RepID=UPI00398ABDEF